MDDAFMETCFVAMQCCFFFFFVRLSIITQVEAPRIPGVCLTVCM